MIGFCTNETTPSDGILNQKDTIQCHLIKNVHFELKMTQTLQEGLYKD